MAAEKEGVMEGKDPGDSNPLLCHRAGAEFLCRRHFLFCEKRRNPYVIGDKRFSGRYVCPADGTDLSAVAVSRGPGRSPEKVSKRKPAKKPLSGDGEGTL